MSLTLSDSYFFYPETSHRTLEEIDLIFAKGYVENKSYVKAAKELPRLSVEDMERLAAQYGLTDEVFNRAHGLVSKDLSSTEHVEQDVTKMA